MFKPDSIAWKSDRNFSQWCKDHKVFSNLELGLSLGSMGVGLELKAPVTEWVNVRAGVDWLPRFNVPLSFNLNTFDGDMPTGNFNRLAQRLYEITGLEVDETVNMTGRGHMLNFKFLVDVFPIPHNRHWHITAGFYAGTSKIADTYNTRDEKPTLVGINIYNNAYEYLKGMDDFYDKPSGNISIDPLTLERWQQKFMEYGRMGVKIGEFNKDIIGENGEVINKEGDPYIMEPSPDGSISARAFVNHFKPYLGAGYATDLDRAKKWHLGVDLGVLFWGGRPDVINYDYRENREINFTTDLRNIRGKVGDYMKIMRAFPVYPVLEVSISYSIL